MSLLLTKHITQPNSSYCPPKQLDIPCNAKIFLYVLFMQYITIKDLLKSCGYHSPLDNICQREEWHVFMSREVFMPYIVLV